MWEQSLEHGCCLITMVTDSYFSKTMIIQPYNIVFQPYSAASDLQELGVITKRK
jgi:hypothetical protein